MHGMDVSLVARLLVEQHGNHSAKEAVAVAERYLAAGELGKWVDWLAVLALVERHKQSDKL